MNRTENFIAMAALAISVDIHQPVDLLFIAYCGAIGFFFVRWFNLMRKENAP